MWWVWLLVGLVLGHVFMFLELLGLGRLRKWVAKRMVARGQLSEALASGATDEKMGVGETNVAIITSEDGTKRTVRER